MIKQIGIKKKILNKMDLEKKIFYIKKCLSFFFFQFLVEYNGDIMQVKGN